MGRPRKPTEQHLTDGTFRADRHGPIPDDGEAFEPPAKPKALKGEAAKFWDEVVALLAGVVRDRDAPELQQMCEWWACWRAASAALAKLTAGTLEYTRAMGAANTASQAFDRIAKRFGLTPADRAILRAEASGPARSRVASRPKTKLDAKGRPKP